MKKEQAYTVRTDLAYEAKEMLVEEQAEKDVSGIISESYEREGVQVDRIQILKEGEKKLQKKQGTYITLFTEGIKNQDTEAQHKASKVLALSLKDLLQQHGIKENSKVLVVGLGNWNVTPDALGPMTVEHILVTNHLFELEYERVAEGYRPVAALSPGVMGVTGLETSDIVVSVINRFKPDFVLVVDALASRSVERLNETIQLTDTGIHPGSGVGNRRKELSEETLGVPVIAIGVPTVVDAVTIASDAFDYVAKYIGREWADRDAAYHSLLPKGRGVRHENLSEEDLPNEDEREKFFGLVGRLNDEEKRRLLNEVLTPLGKNMIVTPKEVDHLMEDLSYVIASGINAALHEAVRSDEAEAYTR